MKKNDYTIYTIIIILVVVVIVGFVGYIFGYDLSSVIAVVSILISVITICALFIQNKHLSDQVTGMQQQSGLTQDTTAYSLAFSILSTFLDNPDLWPYFHDKKQIEKNCSKEKITKIEILSLMMLDYYEAVLCMNKYNPLPFKEKVGWDRYFINEIKKSPALQEIYKKYEYTYKYTLGEQYEKAIKELGKE